MRVNLFVNIELPTLAVSEHHAHAKKFFLTLGQKYLYLT